MSVFVTWIGHAGFKFEVSSASGPKVVYIDPWLTSPVCPEAEKHPQVADLILLSHGHFDHAGDAPAISKDTGALVVAAYELSSWVESKGVTNVNSLNKGGALETDYLTAHFVPADHSGGGPEGGYTGDAGGWVINFKNGAPTIYHAGDTNVFGDMRIISDLYAPKIAFLPIGGKYTMGPYEAAYAVKKLLLSVDTVVPMHYGTFPPLTGTPEQLSNELQKHPERPSVKVHNLVIGERTPLESLL